MSCGIGKKRLVLIFSMFFATLYASADDPFTVSTFNCISVYWTPSGGEPGKNVQVEYRVSGATEWKDALPMKYNPIDGCGNNPATGLRYDKADYRGSIVNLTPETRYDIRVTLEGTSTTATTQATTWSENFPIGETITPGDLTTQYTVSTSGTAGGYILIDGTGSTIDIRDGSDQCIYLDQVEYVIIRGYTLVNGAKYGIRLNKCKNIVIENCDISNWGEEDENGFGKGYQAGIYGGHNDASGSVFQRNKIHHPRWDTNSWAELHDGDYHPDGPQAIALGECYIGNNVFRYNEIWSDSDHYFNDTMGMWSNASYEGFPGYDSDIYGNYIANCWDDGIESEGANTNVRIWNNYIENTYMCIGNAATSIGPLYVYRNVSGRSYSLPGSLYGQYSCFLKMGYSSSITWMTGYVYIFNNTILQPGGEGFGGFGTHEDSNRHVKHCISLNNILHVRDTTDNSISIKDENEDNSFDYDLMNKGYPVGHEAHGISGEPTYAAGAPAFDSLGKIGNFQLDSSSLGYDDGTVIPNFCEVFNGAAPDMGAHESGTDDMSFGVNAESQTLFTVTFSTDGTAGASLTGTTPQNIAYGNNCTSVTAVAPVGFYFVNWTGTGGFVTTTDNPLTVTNVAANMDITANFTASVDSILAQVASGDDDAEEGSEGSGNMYLNSSDLELTLDGNEQVVGMRFIDMAIPAGALIANAYIQFTVDETDSTSCDLTITGELNADAPAFTTTDYNISSRTDTSANVSWSPPAWTTVGAAGADQRTPDISNIIQEIVNQEGWQSGNALVLMINGTGVRTAESYDGDESAAPQLYVEYSMDTVVHSADTNGDWSISQTEVDSFISLYNNNNNTETTANGDITPGRITMREVLRVIYLYNNGGAYIGGQPTVDTYDLD